MSCLLLLKKVFTYAKKDVLTARGGGGGGVVLGLIFAGYVPLTAQSPYLIVGLIVYSVASYRHKKKNSKENSNLRLVTFGQICNIRDPNLVTFYLCIYPILNEEQTFWYVC